LSASRGHQHNGCASADEPRDGAGEKADDQDEKQAHGFVSAYRDSLVFSPFANEAKQA
jgi:hypothetical protein